MNNFFTIRRLIVQVFIMNALIACKGTSQINILGDNYVLDTINTDLFQLKKSALFKIDVIPFMDSVSYYDESNDLISYLDTLRKYNVFEFSTINGQCDFSLEVIFPKIDFDKVKTILVDAVFENEKTFHHEMSIEECSEFFSNVDLENLKFLRLVSIRFNNNVIYGLNFAILNTKFINDISVYRKGG